MKKNLFFAAILAAFFVLIGVGCDNSLYSKEGTDNQEREKETIIVSDVWDPIMVIVLKTTDGQLGTLSFAPILESQMATALSDGTYDYRLHVVGDIFSIGTVTVTVTESGTTLVFVSDSGNEFIGKIEGNSFEFIMDSIPGDSEADEALSFQNAIVPETTATTTAQSIALNQYTLALHTVDNPTTTLTATIVPPNADVQTWWSTDNPALLKIVQDGLSATITAKSGGEAIVKVKTITTTGSTSAECSVTITKPVLPGFFLEEDGVLMDEIDISGQTGDSLLAKAFSYITSTSLTEENYRLIVGEVVSTSTGYTLAKNITLTLQATSEEAGVIHMTGQGALFTVIGSSASDTPHFILGENITLKGNSGNNKAVVIVGDASKNGKLTSLILNDVTGDSGVYGVITSAKKNGAGGDASDSMSVSSWEYAYIVEGVSRSLSGVGAVGVTAGPARLWLSG
ncbi:MAG: hypothetical protein LBS86_01645, partial [Treponema sp.]|nr:hypothetical protein [Treponema sp.]